jgi:hypothetical protein
VTNPPGTGEPQVTLSAKEYHQLLRKQGSTTLSGVQLITFILFAPICFAFVIVGVRFIWSATANPQLLENSEGFLSVFSILLNPLSLGLGIVMGAYGAEARANASKGKRGEVDDED